MDAFERIKRLREEYESALDEADLLRNRYHHEIVKLYRSGVSLREIAEGLGISHQRVHQIVSPPAESKRPRRRAAAAGAVGAVIVLLFGAGYVIGGLAGSDEPAVQATASPQAEELRLPEIAFGCRVSPSDESTFTTITIAAECDRQIERLLRRGDGIDAVLLEPRSGTILALVSGGTGVSTLEGR